MLDPRPESADEYLRAVNQLRQFLAESDSSAEQPAFRSDSKKFDSSSPQTDYSEKSNSVRKSLNFKSPNRRGHHSQTAQTGGGGTDYTLVSLVQRQSLYIKALEKEITLYRREVPGIVNEAKISVSNEEVFRMGQANDVSQRLFRLIDTVSSSKSVFGHEDCEFQRKKLVKDLAEAQQQIQLLNKQWSDHVCWMSQSQAKHLEDGTSDKSEFFITVNKLRATVSNLQQREADALRRVQQSVEVAEQAQHERAQMESEVRRMVSIVEQHEQQVSNLSADHARRLQEERSRWEAKLSEQAIAMKREGDFKNEALARLSLDLEQLQRNESILKNEILVKNNLLESSRQDHQRQMCQMQSEQSKLIGQLTELQRRLGEIELKSELSCKAAQQEASSAQTESEFLRRKVELLGKEAENRKLDYEKALKELEDRNMELHLAASHREEERAQAVKSNSQATSLVKYLEQRELALLHSLQGERKLQNEKCDEFVSIIEEQRSLILSLKEKYASLLEDFQNIDNPRN